MAVPLKWYASGLLLTSFQPASRSFLLPASTRCFSVLNRPPPNYAGHIPLTRTERLSLALGSGLLSFLDPRRGGTPPHPLTHPRFN